MTGHRTLTARELLAEAVERFGDDPRFFAFTCPHCGDVACPQDFIDHGADPQRCGQECIGRSVGALDHGTSAHDAGRSKAERGCDWAAYGLFPGPWGIRYDEGHEVRSFRLTTTEEAETVGLFARRDAAAGSAEPYAAQVRRQLAVYDLMDANDKIPDTMINPEEPQP